VGKKLTLLWEGIFNGSILVLAIAVVVGSIQLGSGGLGRPAAGFFPLFSGLMLLIAQSVVIANTIYRRRTLPGEPVTARAFGKVAALVAIFVAWIVAMPYLGYILVTFAVVLAFAKVLGLEGWLKPLILSAGSSLAVYILFDQLMYLDLPRGPWG
jgi:putative tricarboxylic transport membrane protein